MAGVFGALKKSDKEEVPKILHIEQLALFLLKRYAVFELVDTLIERNTGPTEKELLFAF